MGAIYKWAHRVNRVMSQEDVKTLADVGDSLDEHIESALDSATDESTKFHLRHAKQLLLDLDTVVEKRDSEAVESGAETSA